MLQFKILKGKKDFKIYIQTFAKINLFHTTKFKIYFINQLFNV